MHDHVRRFLAGAPLAVAGASRDRTKFGNRILRAYQRHGVRVFAINPGEADGPGIEGAPTVATIDDLPEPVHGLSIIAPPAVTEQIVEQAIAAGIEHLWMQPGAENPAAIERAESAGLSVIHGGPCVLVELG